MLLNYLIGGYTHYLCMWQKTFGMVQLRSRNMFNWSKWTPAVLFLLTFITLLFYPLQVLVMNESRWCNLPILVTQPFFPHRTLSKCKTRLSSGGNTSISRVFIHFKTSNSAIWEKEMETAEPDMNLQPFTCINEMRWTRFKHSFISIKACCSVHNMFPLTLPWQCGLLFCIISGVKLSFVHYHKMLASVNCIGLLRQGQIFKCSNNEMVDIGHVCVSIIVFKTPLLT